MKFHLVARVLLACAYFTGTNNVFGLDLKNSTVENRKVCRGTNFGLAHTDHTRERYEQYKAQFGGCTHVESNLEIVFLDTPDSYDLEFLSSIREVTGYVLLVGNYADFIPLRNLRVIRGATLFHHASVSYALYVALNYNPETDEGLKELQLVSLREILAGSAFLFNNNQLCYEDKVDWPDILTGKNSKFVYQARDYEDQYRNCGECDDLCLVKGKKHCWGPGPQMCQKIRKHECSPQCDGHCFGELPNQCCHPECAGGCNGPTDRDCWTCKNFDDEGSCKSQCPPQFVYSHSEFKQVPDPNAKFAFGNLCVPRCPLHLIVDNGACVQDCGPGRRPGLNGTCVECNGPCPKTCKVDLKDDFVHMGNIEKYRGCTIVQGRIKILDATFAGDPYNNIEPLDPEALSVFETVQEVTEFVQIQANNVAFRNLIFLRNLRVIHGRKLDRGRASLQIFQTSLEWLGLLSLQEIRNGHALVANNSRLCYVSSINWTSFFFQPQQSAIVQFNRNKQNCQQDNEVCHAECGANGCWGGEDCHCISCKSVVFRGKCLPSCSSQAGLYQESHSRCEQCHLQCRNGCTGPRNDQCKECANFHDGPYCVDKCPSFKYPDYHRICQPCHQVCDPQFGCIGPKSHLGMGGCVACKVLLNDDPLLHTSSAEGYQILTQNEFDSNSLNNLTCLHPESECPDGFHKTSLATFINSSKSFPDRQGDQVITLKACKKCHLQCLGCFGAGPDSCSICLNFLESGKCVEKCSDDNYLDASTSHCKKCDSKCLTCSVSSTNCSTCKYYKLFPQGGDEQDNFTCVESCPGAFPYKFVKRNSKGDIESLCSINNESLISQRKWTLVVIFPSSVLILLGIIVLLLAKKKKSLMSQQNRLVKNVTLFEPVAPSNIQPDMSTVRLIKQSELTVGGIIGSGAFGTVYQGVWLPEDGQPKEKMMVAIKVLIEGREDCGSKELLDEARIMASVDHPCCMRILCICLSPCIMLVTDLMRYGCMLDFLRAHGSLLGSPTLLLWSWQIAQGMTFLEEKGIVHRDLAARNVLVQSLKQVKITDFGLAKLLSFDKGTPLISKRRTRMPIKWLAYESIISQIFTHQSDVWSFGVTIWELLTFGKRPYGSINAMEVIALLEKEGRLSRPDICGDDFYALLLGCWHLDPKERPTFGELSEQLEDMNSQPDRYIDLPLRGQYDELLGSDEGYKSLRLNEDAYELDGNSSPGYRIPTYVNGSIQIPHYINNPCIIYACSLNRNFNRRAGVINDRNYPGLYYNNKFSSDGNLSPSSSGQPCQTLLKSCCNNDKVIWNANKSDSGTLSLINSSDVLNSPINLLQSSPHL